MLVPQFKYRWHFNGLRRFKKTRKFGFKSRSYEPTRFRSVDEIIRGYAFPRKLDTIVGQYSEINFAYLQSWNMPPEAEGDEHV